MMRRSTGSVCCGLASSAFVVAASCCVVRRSVPARSSQILTRSHPPRWTARVAATSPPAHHSVALCVVAAHGPIDGDATAVVEPGVPRMHGRASRAGASLCAGCTYCGSGAMRSRAWNRWVAAAPHPLCALCTSRFLPCRPRTRSICAVCVSSRRSILRARSTHH